MDSPITVGKSSTPTPTGTFYVYNHWKYFDGDYNDSELTYQCWWSTCFSTTSTLFCMTTIPAIRADSETDVWKSMYLMAVSECRWRRQNISTIILPSVQRSEFIGKSSDSGHKSAIKKAPRGFFYCLIIFSRFPAYSSCFLKHC